VAAKAKLVAEFLPAHLESLSKLLAKNGNNGFFVGSKLSYADLGLWAILNLAFTHVQGSREVAEKIPTLKAFLDGVAARDKIKAYLARDVYAKKE
jgi:glutathione S-transferase